MQADPVAADAKVAQKMVAVDPDRREVARPPPARRRFRPQPDERSNRLPRPAGSPCGFPFCAGPRPEMPAGSRIPAGFRKPGAATLELAERASGRKPKGIRPVAAM